MTGPEHYRAAENLIASVNKKVSTGSGMDLFPPDARTRLLAEAQVHATLAVAAAVAIGMHGAMLGDDLDAWADTAGTSGGEPS